MSLPIFVKSNLCLALIVQHIKKALEKSKRKGYNTTKFKEREFLLENDRATMVWCKHWRILTGLTLWRRYPEISRDKRIPRYGKSA